MPNDGANLCNAAMDIVADYHNLFYDNGDPDRAAVYYAVAEWCDNKGSKSVPVDKHGAQHLYESYLLDDAQQLYDAALVFVCRWAGIPDVAGFKRFLSTRKEASHA